jgi:hypothetical protein
MTNIGGRRDLIHGKAQGRGSRPSSCLGPETVMRDSETVQGKTVRQARFNPFLDSVACTIVTIERHSSDRLSAGPLYICALHAHRARPPLRVFLLYRVDNRIHAYSTRTAPFRASAEVLANYEEERPSAQSNSVLIESIQRVLPAFYSHRLGSTPTVPETIESLHAIPSNRKFR